MQKCFQKLKLKSILGLDKYIMSANSPQTSFKIQNLIQTGDKYIMYADEKYTSFNYEEAHKNYVAGLEFYLKALKMIKNEKESKELNDKVSMIFGRAEICKKQISGKFEFKEKAGFAIQNLDKKFDIVKEIMQETSSVPLNQAYQQNKWNNQKEISKEETKQKLISNSNSRVANIEEKYIKTIEESILEKDLKVKWSDLVGMAEAKKKLYETIILPTKNPELFKGIRSPAKGILLYGPPGNGKTMIARAVSSECKGVSFFNVSAGMLTSKWFGESEKIMQALFAVAAERQPSVVFIDEVDSILTRRSENEHEASKRLKTQFLVQIDGVQGIQEDKVLVIAATNRPFDLDDAALRRFSARIYVAQPDEEARKSMIESMMKQIKNELSPNDIAMIVQRTKGYSFSDLSTLCKEAAFEPIREIPPELLVNKKESEIRGISFKDLENVLKKVPPSTSNKTIEEFIKWQKQKEGN